MYTGLLHIHSISRWLILATALFAIAFAYSGWISGRKWKGYDNLAGLLLTLLADLQFLTGLLLYFVYSPFIKAAFNDFGAAMKEQELRFYAVEHFLMMAVAVVLIHIGRSKSRKASIAKEKHRLAAVFYSIALVIIFAAIPWSRGIF